MPRPEFEEEGIWDRLYAAEENQQASGFEEHSLTEGEDGELEFDRRVFAAATGKDVIDIGCGIGEFTLGIARTARRVAGIDFSNRAISRALENQRSMSVRNCEFKASRADKLPFLEGTFDLAMSRRGPALDTDESTRESFRVLRHGGEIMVQEIGERDKQNWARIFGARGQMFPASGKISLVFKKRLASAGFRNIQVDEFEANEYFASIQDVLIRMENSPIIPDFNKELDQQLIDEIAKKFNTSKGIVTNTHRVLIRGVK